MGPPLKPTLMLTPPLRLKQTLQRLNLRRLLMVPLLTQRRRTLLESLSKARMTLLTKRRLDIIAKRLELRTWPLQLPQSLLPCSRFTEDATTRPNRDSKRR